MAKEDLTPILEAAKRDFCDKKIVVFIGKPQSGKTVISTLLFDTLSGEFLRKYGKKFHAKVRFGHNEIDKTHRRMFVKGRFPAATLPNSRSEIRYEITSKEPLGTKIEFMMKDASGEDIQEIMEKEYDDPKELIKIILTKHKESTDPYGPLSYLLFAKIFVMLLDSELVPEWSSEQLRYSQIITSIYDMKNFIDETANDKIINPIAIVLTKTDELKLKDPEKTLNEKFLETKLPLFYSNIKNSHMGKLDIFKFSINNVRGANPEETSEIIDEENKEFNYQKEEEKKQKLENARIKRERKIEQRVKNARDKEYQTATAEGQPKEVIQERCYKAAQNEQIIAEEAYPIEDLIDNSDNTLEGPNRTGKRHLIELPVKYSKKEYVRFISWLIENVL